MIDPKDVTIIIPHLGTDQRQEYAFQQNHTSLLETFSGGIIVAKNGEACIHKCDVTISAQGQCKAVNAAAATVNTPWIFVTNDDMIYAPRWWELLTRFTNPAVLCISPQLVEPRSGAPTFQVQDFGGADGSFDKEKWLNYAINFMEYETWHDIRRGFNLPFLIKKELWDLIGGYDIDYDPWGSNGDSDLEYKIKLAGVQPYQSRNSIVYHFSQTSGTFNPENDSYRFRNYAYFKEKWGFDRTDEGIWEATFEIPKPPIRKFVPWWENFYGSK